MADSLDGNSFTIASYTPGHEPVGVNITKQATQIVYVGAPVHDWRAHRVGKDTYRLSVGGYSHIGVEEGKVVASIHQEYETLWEITHQAFQKAYTIALADKPHLGWTIPVDAESHAGIVIGLITSTRSVPPQFLPRQLFLIKRAGGE